MKGSSKFNSYFPSPALELAISPESWFLLVENGIEKLRFGYPMLTDAGVDRARDPGMYILTHVYAL